MIVGTSSARLRFAQQQAMPVEGLYNLHCDDRDGVVDYATAINPSPIPAWPDGAGKIGDGLGPDGVGLDGIGHGGVGDGVGGDGLGPDGFGVGMLTAVTPELADGTYRIAVVGSDAAGNPASPADSAIVTIDLAGMPRPPRTVLATDYDGERITFTWALSPDDEG